MYSSRSGIVNLIVTISRKNSMGEATVFHCIPKGKPNLRHSGKGKTCFHLPHGLRRTKLGDPIALFIGISYLRIWLLWLRKFTASVMLQTFFYKFTLPNSPFPLPKLKTCAARQLKIDNRSRVPYSGWQFLKPYAVLQIQRTKFSKILD